MRTELRKGTAFLQFVKFGIVGILNTCITLLAIYICKSLIGVNPYVSNAIGYGLGLLNSFFWNRNWVFRSKKTRINRQILLFLLGFGVCYLLQLFIVWVLTNTLLYDFEIPILSFTLSGYGLATVIGNIAYTISNFIYNKFLTFKN